MSTMLEALQKVSTMRSLLVMLVPPWLWLALVQLIKSRTQG